MAYNQIPSTGQKNMAGSLPVVVASDQTAVPISAASLPLPTGAAADATLTNGTQQTKITDGTNTASVKAASTAAVATDKAVVVAVSPNNSVAVTGTFWQSTQPVSGTVSINAVPTGTNTIGSVKVTDGTNTGTIKAASTAAAATDTAIVVAVSPNNTVSSTQSGTWTVTSNAGTNLNTSALALESGGNLATIAGHVVAQGTALGTIKNAMIGGSVTTSAPTYTTGNINPISLTTAGAVRTDSSAVTQPVSGTVSITANSAVNIAQVNGVTTSTGNGVSGTGVQRVTLASDSTGQVALAAGSNLAGKFGIDQTTVGTTNGVTPVPATTGGPLTSRIKSAATTNATSVKASAGQVYGYDLTNTTSSMKYLKLYNKASAPTVGTDTPLYTIGIPANGGRNVEWSMGIPFGTGIAYAITGAITDADTTATAADDVHGVLLYK